MSEFVKPEYLNTVVLEYSGTLLSFTDLYTIGWSQFFNICIKLKRSINGLIYDKLPIFPSYFENNILLIEVDFLLELVVFERMERFDR